MRTTMTAEQTTDSAAPSPVRPRVPGDLIAMSVATLATLAAIVGTLVLIGVR